ncbi:hypothetical protein [Pseudorhodoplanes sp.]|uniref:hypothetical protein n=1 Tax=Pseudorhodoplanes sp. TaxID=1934341 RepID=UPI00391BC824
MAQVGKGRNGSAISIDKAGTVAAFARSDTAFTRAFSETGLGQGLFGYGKAGADALADRFYAATETALKARPYQYPFDDLTRAVMVRRRG